MQRTLFRSALFIFIGAILLLLELILILLGWATMELPEQKIDTLSLVLAIGTWVSLLIGVYNLSLLDGLTKQKKFLRITMVGLSCYTLGCVAMLLQWWQLIFIIPAGLLLTAVGMVLFGAFLQKQNAWLGWEKFIILFVGLYPFLFMFPLVAIQGVPDYRVNYLWGIPWLLFGINLYLKSKRG